MSVVFAQYIDTKVSNPYQNILLKKKIVKWYCITNYEPGFIKINES